MLTNLTRHCTFETVRVMLSNRSQNGTPRHSSKLLTGFNFNRKNRTINLCNRSGWPMEAYKRTNVDFHYYLSLLSHICSQTKITCLINSFRVTASNGMKYAEPTTLTSQMSKVEDKAPVNPSLRRTSRGQSRMIAHFVEYVQSVTTYQSHTVSINDIQIKKIETLCFITTGIQLIESACKRKISVWKLCKYTLTVLLPSAKINRYKIRIALKKVSFAYLKLLCHNNRGKKTPQVVSSSLLFTKRGSLVVTWISQELQPTERTSEIQISTEHAKFEHPASVINTFFRKKHKNVIDAGWL